MPGLVELIFDQLMPGQRGHLVEAIVRHLERKARVAFDCLDRLLDAQIQRKDCQVEFLAFLPVFVLPVVQAIQVQQAIYPPDGAQKSTGRVMKLLAKLIQLLPLNLTSGLQESASAAGMQASLAEKAKQGLDFLKVFADNKIVTDYELIVPMKPGAALRLRDYQREGVNWMAVLGYYNLNCALADDMGLGKTLQSLTVVLNESEKIKRKQIAEHGSVVDRPVNLVICPTTLTFNWLHEVEKFFLDQKVAVIEGGPAERDLLLSSLHEYDVVIVNYEKVKSCLPAFLKQEFFYLVLDEAHKIKNSKSLITQSVKQLKASRKLVLSGTPLQNRVSELWSLFDFLMPDFLEEEAVFNKMYNKYLTGNIKKMQEKLEETESFIQALKSLKRRIAPFILRRTKEQVLKELPPKVI